MHFEQHDVRGQEALKMMQFLAYSGCRIEEARQVQWRHVDFEKGTLLITGGECGTKNMKQRLLPLFAPLKALLLRMSEGKDVMPAARIFTHQSSKTALKSASKAIGIEEGSHFTHHDMRHFFLQQCHRAEYPGSCHCRLAWPFRRRNPHQDDLWALEERIQRRHGKADGRSRVEPIRKMALRYERARPGELLHLDIKKLGRIQRPGHRVTGSRQVRAHGKIGWEFVFVAIDVLFAPGLRRDLHRRTPAPPPRPPS